LNKHSKKLLQDQNKSIQDSDDSGHNSHDSSRKNSNENTPNTSIGKLVCSPEVDQQILNSPIKLEKEEVGLENYYTPLKLEHNSLKRKSDALTPGFNCSANFEKSRLENSSLDLQFFSKKIKNYKCSKL